VVITPEDLQQRYEEDTSEPGGCWQYETINVTTKPKVGAIVHAKLQNLDVDLHGWLQKSGMLDIYRSDNLDASLAAYVTTRRFKDEQKLKLGSVGYARLTRLIVQDRLSCQTLKSILNDIDSLLHKRELGSQAFDSLAKASCSLSSCVGCLVTLCA
jgi:hypothetical protein